jgi:hypothetical protein
LKVKGLGFGELNASGLAFVSLEVLAMFINRGFRV